jgi:methionyl-tRNA formyltransferase
MVWWAEPDTPMTRALYAESNRPGEILSVAPLVIAASDGALELTKVEWRGAPVPELRVGQIL